MTCLRNKFYCYFQVFIFPPPQVNSPLPFGNANLYIRHSFLNNLNFVNVLQVEVHKSAIFCPLNFFRVPFLPVPFLPVPFFADAILSGTIFFRLLNFYRNTSTFKKSILSY